MGKDEDDPFKGLPTGPEDTGAGYVILILTLVGMGIFYYWVTHRP